MNYELGSGGIMNYELWIGEVGEMGELWIGEVGEMGKLSHHPISWLLSPDSYLLTPD